MPYYTGQGDAGKTSICDTKKVAKTSSRIEAIGNTDELNCAIGLAKCRCDDRDMNAILGRVQNELFALGSDLAAPLDSKIDVPRITEANTRWMETEIDKMAKEIGELKSFILPGGSKLAAMLHLARATCRRAERSICRLAADEKINEADLPYINRLSSLLFVLARMANERAKVKDTEWKSA